MVPLEGLLVFPCLPFPSALWVMHLLTYPGGGGLGLPSRFLGDSRAQRTRDLRNVP